MLEEDEDKVKIEFAISDTGIGIPESKINNILKISNKQQAVHPEYMGNRFGFGYCQTTGRTTRRHHQSKK